MDRIPQIFEALMLICFGASWPFSIFKMARTRRTEGKSAVFIVLVLTGYVAGLIAKLAAAALAHKAPQPVTFLYAFNAALVGIDLGLFVKLSKNSVAADVSRQVEIS